MRFNMKKPQAFSSCMLVALRHHVRFLAKMTPPFSSLILDWTAVMGVITNRIMPEPFFPDDGCSGKKPILMALRYRVWVRLMNRIHFVGADRPHPPTLHALHAAFPEGRPGGGSVTELVCEIKTSIQPPHTKRRGGILIMHSDDTK
jgi:hypothetical protein